MRPLKLVMNAFGPYAGRQEIDFTELRDNSLFLINGPTGGGKTTILDAICFALYGETSGKERDDKHLRSDLAEPTDIAEVELTFAVGKRMFSATRSPTQERAKIHGDGTTVQQAKAQLLELGPDGEDQEVLGTKIGQVNSYISDLLGFQSDQFRQVIMLPQGQFRKLLLSDSRERGQILARLFDTSIYRLMEENLKDRARQIRSEIGTLKTTIEARLEHFGFEKVKQLKKKGKSLDKGIEKSEGKLRKLKKKEESAQKSLNEGRGVEQKFITAETNRHTLAVLEKQTEAIEKKRSKFKRANQAELLTDAHSRYNYDLEQADQAETARVDAERAQQQASEAYKQAEIQLAESEKSIPEIEKLQADLVRLEELSKKLTGLETARSDFESVEGKVTKADQALKAKQDEIGQATEKQDEVEKFLKELSAKQVDEALLALRISGIKDEIKNRTEMTCAQASHKKVADDLGQVEIQLEEQNKAIAKLELRLKKLSASRAAGHAILLAGSLEPGEPCPVCGSLEHPELASGAEEIPGEEVIEDADRQLEESRKQKVEIDTRRQELTLELSRLDERIRGGMSALESLADRTLESANQELQTLDQQQEEQRAIRGQLKEDTLKADQLKKHFEGLGGEYSELETQQTTDKLELEAARARMEERKETIPEQFREAQALNNEISIKNAQCKRLQLLRDTARKNHAESRDQLTQADSELKNARKQFEKLGKVAEKSTREWAERLSSQGFESERDFLDAKLDIQLRKALDTEITSFDRNVERARGLAEASTKAISNLKRPDLSTLETNWQEALLVREQRQEKLAGLKNEQVHVSQALTDLQQTSDNLKSLRNKYRVVGDLSDIANGSFNRMSFQRFVLAALLDDVLRQSSERLNTMSKGRYRLYRTNYQSEQHRSGGLDLEVEDAYSGKSRPVSTLSGGESFQAALSLALGLADVVQAYAGGVMLDTIFIDEGFGSLDEEALDLAINTLIDLQASGRLVGVISHVAEMKERIDAQLVVSSGDRGAMAEFKLP